MGDFTAKERVIINAAWYAMERAASMSATSVAIELADSLKYETGSRQAGRQKIWAKALIVDAWVTGTLGATEDRRKWLSDAIGISRGIRFGYLLGCARLGLNAQETKASDLMGKARAAADVLLAAMKRPHA